MTISDQSRHRLHQRLDEILGADDAATLMEHLPPVGWADVATKRDLERLATEVRGEMSVGFAEVRAELHKEIGTVHKEIGGLRGDMGRQTQTLFFGLAGFQLSGGALAIALSRLL